METARWRSPYLRLTKLFLRQFLENDLISPDADRTQLLAVVGAMVVTLTLFISTFMSFGYAASVLMPGEAASLSLTDKYFYLSLAMIATALVAATQWDALAIDPRDAAILEPLPVRASTIRRAKLSAVAILGAAVTIAVNGAPSLIFPWMLVYSFQQMRFIALVAIIATHAAVTIAASTFGYLVVMALREVLPALLGARAFTRVSPWAQGALIVVLGSALLLLPPASDRIAERGFTGWRSQSPPMWFLGAYEMAAGGLIADLPRGGQMTPRQAARDREYSAIYEARRQLFPQLAGRAAAAFGLALVAAFAAYIWNARRLPSLAPVPPPSFRRRWRLLTRLANALLVRGPAARAGFYFTLAAMWRSSTHRLTLACAAAAGLAMAVLAVSNVNVEAGASPRLLAMQPLLYGALLVAFRHVIRVPAELRANWGFQLAWRGRERAFVAGVKRAAYVALLVPAIAIVLPFFAIAIDVQPALAHALLGIGGGIVFLEALLVTYDKVPFTCTYLPSENMKGLAPLYAVGFVLGASLFARAQYNALQNGTVITGLVVLAVAYAILRVATASRARLPQIEFDEAPATYQRLGLYT